MALGNYGRSARFVAFSSHSKLLAIPMNPVESDLRASLNSDDYLVSFHLLPQREVKTPRSNRLKFRLFEGME